jgi:hypothetical protein
MAAPALAKTLQTSLANCVRTSEGHMIKHATRDRQANRRQLWKLDQLAGKAFDDGCLLTPNLWRIAMSIHKISSFD